MYTKSTAAACLALLALSIAPLAGAGGGTGTGTYAANVPGRGALTADWWQWAFEIPASMNPILDQTGEYAHVGQEGPIFFLAGTPGGSATRTVTVPAGKIFFFPILNTIWWACPGEPITVPELRRGAAGWLANMVELELTLDGMTLGTEELLDHRAKSPVFGFTVPEEWVAQGACGPFPTPPGTHLFPAVSDGYWILLPPLTPGSHELHFYGAVDDPTWGLFEIEVTYHLTIE